MHVLPCLLLFAVVGANSPTEYIQIEVDAVRVSTRRPGSDEPWRTVKERGSGGGCALLSMVPGIPGIASTLCSTVGSSVSGGSGAHLASAPDIFVRVSAGKTAFRSYIVHKTFSHKFGFRALVPTNAIPRNGLVVDVVADDGKDTDETKETIGSFRYAAATLLDAANGGKMLGGSDGGVEKLELMVEPWQGKTVKGKFQFQVAKGMQAVDDVEVLAGQVVEISASGEYRMPSQARPVGPNGVIADVPGLGIYPDEPFKSGRLGAAMVRVGKGGAMKGALVYSCASLVAPYLGLLVVGVNRQPSNSLSGSLTFDYSVRPATIEEWQTGRAQGCASATETEDEGWPSRGTGNAVDLIRGRATMAGELLKLTHPTGKDPAITGVRPFKSAQAPAGVEIELSWSGGFSRKAYVTRITWAFARDRHVQTTVSDEGGVPFQVDPQHRQRLDAFFRDEIFPQLGTLGR